MKKINLILSILILSVVLGTVSCNSWLDVKANDKIMENEIFGSRKKFLSALNGVYIELANSSLYGASLSYGMIDVMGQYYKTDGNHSYALFSTYSYGDSGIKSKMDVIWSKAYEVIINCNTILEHCGESNSILGPELHSIVKGEALALRAILHFDLLRLFGPSYNDETKGKQSIPYLTSSDPVINPLESSEIITSKIIADLEQALTLLSNDPVITQGALNQNNPDGENTLYFRQYRLNYFAVKALLARVYLWKGDKVSASKYAKEVIADCQKGSDATSQLFPFISNAYATHPLSPDRIFHTEVLFALYNTTRNTIFTGTFNYNVNPLTLLTFAGKFENGRIPELYNDQNDYRYKMWNSATYNDAEVPYFNKFEGVNNYDNWSAEPFRFMMPLIRISEMYLIAAECTSDYKEAAEYINKIRKARACINIGINSDSEQMKYIIDEFRREMIGEGQMFFLYKRLALESIPDGNATSGDRTMGLGNYIVPLPDSEISQRPDYVK